jgi:hypothetical protein
MISSSFNSFFAIREVRNLHLRLCNKSPFAPLSGLPMLSTICLLEQLSQHTCRTKFRKDPSDGLLHRMSHIDTPDYS